MASRLRYAIALVLLSVPAFATEWTPVRAFRTFSKSMWRGLPQTSVMALAQDRDGILWIGTLDGAASFDGRTIAPVPAVKDAPLRGIIAGIVARKAGGVYIASQAGIHIYDGSAWMLVPTKSGPASIAEASDGVLWMADGAGGLHTLTRDGKWHDRTDVKQPIVAVAAAQDGTMWAATSSGALHIAGNRIETIDGLPSAPGALLVASDGRIWTATQGCSIHWTRGAGDTWHQVALTPWPRGAFRCLAEDRHGRIWAGSFGGHVAFGTADSAWTVWDGTNGPLDAGVMAILRDREGTLWFGLNGVGLAQWIGEGISLRPTIDVANPRNTYGAFGLTRGAAPGTILFSAFNLGILRFGPGATEERFGPANGITQDVRVAAEPQPGTMFVGERFGLLESHDGGRHFTQVLKLPSGFVMGFFESPDHRWYAATSANGVYVRDANGWHPAAGINAAIEHMHVRHMAWLRNGELWVSTLRGVTIFRSGNAPQQLSRENNRAMPESVNSVLELPNGDVWAAGTGGVAVRHGDAWQHMGESDGTPGKTIYSLAFGRHGEVWAGGSAGFGRFANGRWNVWDARDGLPQEECNLNSIALDDSGGVYFGTMAGLVHYDPSLQPPPHPPLKVLWRTTPPRELAPGDRALHLLWTAPYLGGHPVQYRVRVPRLHDAWEAPTSEDHLDIENLSAGDWRVEVEARVEGEGDWTPPLVLDIFVPPFWYETMPARIGFIVLIALGIYVAVRLRLRALRHHAAMLEATVRERTAQLAEKVELLRDSEQRALAASRAKSTFLANMSHELRTPLNGILGFAQLLSRRKDRDADDRQGLDVILKSGEHLLGLINDVLSLSKIEAGRVTLDETRFDPTALVRDVEHLLRLRAEEKALRFTSEIDPRMPHFVRGDEVRLRQILINLVGNAVKFTETGSVTVRARWSNGRAQIEVDDTGPGIAADELSRLFEPFVQSESGYKSSEGTGLGLAVSRNLARLMDGDITAESTLGKGARFRLDVALPEAAADEPQLRDTRRVVALAPGQEQPRILVVDDTPVNRAVLSKLLTWIGFEVREAATAAEAIDAWRSWEPSLIWMDKRMTGVDGLDVTRAIRAEERAAGRKHVPIIALSASALDHERGEILEAGCDDFVAKPFRESVIFAKIAEHLDVKYVYEEAEQPKPEPSERAETLSPQPSVLGPSILLVDDDWICRRVATEMLRVNGVGVTTASSGREALDLMDHNRFDLVFMDLHMPDMGGVETARQMRAKAGSARLPIIAMSADTFDGEAARLKESGLDGYVGKPVEAEALNDVLRKWL